MKTLLGILKSVFGMLAFIVVLIAAYCVPFFYFGVKLIVLIPFEIFKYLAAMILFCVFFVLTRKICRYFVPKILGTDE